jgi:hypothetical protein
MSEQITCPVCGAAGNRPCDSSSGRDHKARIRAEEAAKRATRSSSPARPWDGEAVIRVVRAEGKRVGAKGTEHDLERLAAVRSVLEDSLLVAVAGLRERGVSWSEIGSSFGVGKSAAFQKYEPRIQKLNAAQEDN